MSGPSVRRGLVSVVIPAFNAAPYLAEAVDSVLAQTYRPLEIIVVDDGSSDATAEVALSYGQALTFDPCAHAGVNAAFNHGLARARGEFIAGQDADDRWAPQKLEMQMAALAADPALDMVFCQIANFYSPELDAAARSRLQFPEGAIAGVGRQCMLIWRAAFERVGLFNEQWQIGDFAEWYARALDGGLRTLVLDEVLVQRRIHGANMTLRERDNRGDYARVLKAVLDRRRAARS